MKMKSVSNCLNFTDGMILSDASKHVGFGNLEDVRDYIIGMYSDEYIDYLVIMSGLLSQKNLIIEQFYLDDDCDFKEEYWTLKQHILA